MQHPRSETLYLNAAGRLPEPHAALVTAHLDVCPICRRGTLAAERAIGETLSRQTGTEQPPPGLVPQLINRLRQPERPPCAAPDLVVRWREVQPRWVAPGLYIRTVAVQGSFGLHLVRADRGRGIPPHSHRGPEMALVLEGTFVDRGRIYGPGDIREVEDADDHQQVTVQSDSTLALLATAGGRLRFNGWAAGLLHLWTHI